MKPVVAYTDGACLGNPGPGGYGVVLLWDGHRRELSRGYRWTTNNRMELRAAIAALEALKRSCRVLLWSDSQYLVHAIRLGWLERWKRQGWKRSGRLPVRNADLWRQLDRLLERHEVELRWTRGHAGDPENERADTLAVAAAQGTELVDDDGFGLPPAGAEP